jgi:hypothetical protein
MALLRRKRRQHQPVLQNMSAGHVKWIKHRVHVARSSIQGVVGEL